MRLRSEFFTEVKMFFDNSLVWKVIIYVLHVLSISVLTLACHRVMIIVTNIYDCEPNEVYDIITITDYICGEKYLTKVDFLAASNCFTISPVHAILQS